MDRYISFLFIFLVVARFLCLLLQYHGCFNSIRGRVYGSAQVCIQMSIESNNINRGSDNHARVPRLN